MANCKACGEWFVSFIPSELCTSCTLALKRLGKYVAPVMHGRWSWDTGDIWTCSVCGTRNHIKEVMGRPDFNYCPDCGAHMNKEATDGN